MSKMLRSAPVLDSVNSVYKKYKIGLTHYTVRKEKNKTKLRVPLKMKKVPPPGSCMDFNFLTGKE
jgi:hypothetical protein